MAFKPGVQGGSTRKSTRRQTITIRSGSGRTTITDTRLRDPKTGSPSQSSDAVLVTTSQTGTGDKQVISAQTQTGVQVPQTIQLQQAREAAERESAQRGELSARTTLNLLRAQANQQGQVPREAFLEIGRLDPSALKVPDDDALTFTRFEKENIFLKPSKQFTGRVDVPTAKELKAQKQITQRLFNRLDEFNRIKRTKRGGLTEKQALEQGATVAALEGLAAGKAFGRTLKDTALGTVSIVKGIPKFVRSPVSVTKTQASSIKQGLIRVRNEGVFTGISRGEPGAFGEAVGTVAAAIAIQKAPVGKLGKVGKLAKPSSILKAAKIPKSVVSSLRTSRVATRLVKTKTFKKAAFVTNKAKQRFGVAVDAKGNLVVFVGKGARVKAKVISKEVARAQLKTPKDISTLSVSDLKKLRSKIGVSQNKGGDPVIFLGRGSQQKAAKLTRAVERVQQRAKVEAETLGRVTARAAARKKALQPRQIKLRKLKEAKIKAAQDARIQRNIQRIKRQKALRKRQLVRQEKISKLRKRIKEKVPRLKIKRKLKEPDFEKIIRENIAKRKKLGLLRAKESKELKKLLKKRAKAKPKALRERLERSRKRVRESQLLNARFERRIRKIREIQQRKPGRAISRERKLLSKEIRNQQRFIKKDLASQERIRKAIAVARGTETRRIPIEAIKRARVVKKPKPTPIPKRQVLVTVAKKKPKSAVALRFERRIRKQKVLAKQKRQIQKQKSLRIRREQKIKKQAVQLRKQQQIKRRTLRRRTRELKKRVRVRKARLAKPVTAKDQRDRFPLAISRFKTPPSRFKPPTALLRPAAKEIVKTKRIVKVKPKPRQRVRTIQKIKPVPKVRVRTRAKARVITKVKAKVTTKALVKTKIRARQILKTKQKTVRLPRLFRRTDKKKQRLFRKDQGFNTFIKERKAKNFFQANRKPQRIKRATNLGSSITDKSTAATFRIKPVAKRVKQKDARKFLNLQKFRKPKRGSKIKRPAAIERRRFRIDSGGEKSGITAKGLLAVRRAAQRRKLQKKLGTIKTSKKRRRR